LSASSGVQSLERAFDLLEELADAGGILTLSELAARSGLPLPTIHRLLRTLVRQGYVRRTPDRRYALGPRLIRLGESAGRLLGGQAGPFLTELTAATGETANLAVLESGAVVYVGQVPSPHAVRMFTEVGRRVEPHCTAVGKVLLAQLPRAEAARVLGPGPLTRHTDHTITDPAALLAQLDVVRERGYAVDDQEQELGVRCLAVVVPGAPAPTALSVSGPDSRVRALPENVVVATAHAVAARLGAVLGG